MFYASHTWAWAWAWALTGLQFLPTSNTAPTSSTLSLSRPSNFLNQFPCIPALTHSLKPSIFPISTLCTKPTNATLQNDRSDGFWAWPPFALFSMEDYPPKIINSILKKAHNDPSVDQWWWYLATSSYSAAPQKTDEPIFQKWTAAPISPSFQSPFVGKTLQDAADWLQNKPESVALDPHFFGLLDKQAGESGKVAMCRIGDRYLKGEEVTCILWKAETSTLTLVGQEYGDWDDILAGNVGPYTPDI